MKNCRTFFTVFLWFILLTAACFAKDWHNIYPLQTTRAEVVKLLGEPQKSQTSRDEYFRVDDNIVIIRWVRADCDGDNLFIRDKPPDPSALVFQISVSLKVPLEKLPPEFDKTKKDYGANKSDAKSAYRELLSQDVDCFGDWCTIMNRQKGIGYVSSKTGIDVLHYFPNKEEFNAWKEKHKTCSSEYIVFV